MQERKFCQKCCKPISNIYESDYYSHIRIKYCKECAVKVDREKAAQRMKEVRKKARENNRLRRQLNDKLLQENELLKRQLEQARERIEVLSR